MVCCVSMCSFQTGGRAAHRLCWKSGNKIWAMWCRSVTAVTADWATAKKSTVGVRGLAPFKTLRLELGIPK